MTEFFRKLKALLLSYPDKNYIDWKIAALKRMTIENTGSSLLMQNILFRTESGVSSERCCNEELIVSLSTFGARINGVALTIESLLEQTVRPNRVILNLNREFDGPGKMPGSLRRLESRGLEFRFVRDLGPYTKLLPTLKEFPDATIITVDDDVLYDYDLVSTLVNAHLGNPSSIVGTRCRVVQTGSDGQLKLPFMSWPFAGSGSGVSRRLLAEGVGGVLYPPGALDERVFDEKTFMSVCPTTDDFWFKVMSLLRGTDVCKCYGVEDSDLKVNPKSRGCGTLHQSNEADGYDRQLQALWERFGLEKLI